MTDYAQESALWKAIGEVEGAHNELQEQIDWLRRRDRLSYARFLIFGLLLGTVAFAVWDAATPNRYRLGGDGVFYTGCAVKL